MKQWNRVLKSTLKQFTNSLARTKSIFYRCCSRGSAARSALESTEDDCEKGSAQCVEVARLLGCEGDVVAPKREGTRR